ncbi:MAG TPA: hypothetical protein VGE21_06320 [Flavobacteriales bacterium]
MLALLWGLLAPAAFAQGKGESLTDDFPKLSSKERSRIANKENREAQEDAAYQQEMQQAEAAFQAKHYEEALAGYERARALRPYNVYPKVKIEDLRVLLKQVPRSAEPTPAVIPEPAVEVPAAVPEPAPMPPPASVPVPVVDTPGRPATNKPPAPTPALRSAPVAADPVPASSAVQDAELLPDGIHERQYQQGRAYVVERTVMHQGEATVYKRVIHPAGQTFYFQDGRSVDERVWKERFDRP